MDIIFNGKTVTFTINNIQTEDLIREKRKHVSTKEPEHANM